jgi:hypothetical protein
VSVIADIGRRPAAGALLPQMLVPLLLGEVVLVFGSRLRSWVSVRARPD